MTHPNCTESKPCPSCRLDQLMTATIDTFSSEMNARVNAGEIAPVNAYEAEAALFHRLYIGAAYMVRREVERALDITKPATKLRLVRPEGEA